MTREDKEVTDQLLVELQHRRSEAASSSTDPRRPPTHTIPPANPLGVDRPTDPRRPPVPTMQGTGAVDPRQRPVPRTP
eukprot:11537694-Heterocapsa_arctica.AAC.1